MMLFGDVWFSAATCDDVLCSVDNNTTITGHQSSCPCPCAANRHTNQPSNQPTSQQSDTVKVIGKLMFYN